MDIFSRMNTYVSVFVRCVYEYVMREIHSLYLLTKQIVHVFVLAYLLVYVDSLRVFIYLCLLYGFFVVKMIAIHS